MADFEKFLLDQRLLSAGDVTAMRALGVGEDASFLHKLRDSGVLAPAELASAVACYHQVPLAEPEDWPDAPAFADELSLSFLRENRVYPLKDTGTALELAMEDPGDVFVLRAIALATERKVSPRAASAEDILAALERWSRQRDAAPLNAPPEGEAGRNGALSESDVEHLRDLALETPVIREVNNLIEEAVYARATDIHVEPFDARVKVRIRVDGLLRDISPPPKPMARAIVSRIKILAGLDIAERRLPQDGRARVRVNSRQLDLRVATMPTIHGEAVAIRILENARRALDFGRLGFSSTDREKIERQLSVPHGMVVVTGPTGSGKTTTLATALSMLNQSKRKILTIEDPIEYELEGVNQTQIKPEIGLTFSTALRSFLRHDPDVIMVGEMRDRETAGIALHAALTGHLVLTTLHTNNAAAAITRLLDMGVDAYLLASSLRCVVGQRLVRVLCQHCRKRSKKTNVASACEPVADQSVALRNVNGWHATGCERCHGTGFSDRTAISEVLEINDAVRSLIAPGHTSNEIEEAAVRGGMTTMMQDGRRKCTDGQTTLAEVCRVTLDG